MAAPVPISALAGNAAVREALGIVSLPQKFINIRRDQRRTPLPEPVVRYPKFLIFDLRDVRAWAEKKDWAFHVEADIDTGPTIDPDRLTTTSMIADLFGVSVMWVSHTSQSPHRNFPEPVVVLSGRRFWDTTVIEAWAEANGRKTYHQIERPPAGS